MSSEENDSKKYFKQRGFDTLSLLADLYFAVFLDPPDIHDTFNSEADLEHAESADSEDSEKPDSTSDADKKISNK